MQTMMLLFLAGLLWFHTALAAITPFQKNISACLKNQVDVVGIKNLDGLYRVLEKKFPLRTTEILYREVLFKKHSNLQKLKFENGKLALYKVLEDKSLKLMNNDVRQKGLTEESSINDLLVGADIQEDWLKAREIRSGQSVLQYSRQHGKMTALSFKKIGAKETLECSLIELSDICLCRR